VVVFAPDTAAFPALASGRHSRPRFGACSGFTRVTARGLAALPKRTFVRVARRPRFPGDRPPVATRLYHQLPRQDSHLQERAAFHGTRQRMAAKRRR
jgi:hypothetical protein